MSANKQLIERFYKALGSGDGDAMASIISEDIVATAHGTCVMSGQRTYEEVIEALSLLANVTQNGIDFTILSMTEEEDRISCEVSGESVLVTGQDYNNRYHFMFRLRDERIVSIDEYFDTKLVDELFLPLVNQ